MPKPLHYFEVVPFAQKSLGLMTDRLRKWMARSPEDMAKIGERADELRDIAKMLDWVEMIINNMSTWRRRDRQEGIEAGYRQGWENAKEHYERLDYNQLLLDSVEAKLLDKSPGIDLQAPFTDDELADLYTEMPDIMNLIASYTPTINSHAA